MLETICGDESLTIYIQRGDKMSGAPCSHDRFDGNDGQTHSLLCDEEFKTFLLNSHFTEAFHALYRVVQMGAKKHGQDNWLRPNGSKSSRKDNCASMFRHLSSVSAGVFTDEESGEGHEIHLACRALMGYTRRIRKIEEEQG